MKNTLVRFGEEEEEENGVCVWGGKNAGIDSRKLLFNNRKKKKMSSCPHYSSFVKFRDNEINR